MRNRHSKTQFLILITIIFLMAYSNSSHGAVKGTFLYNLSNFTGSLPYNWARVFVDKERTEVYVVYQNLIRVFNGNGMEIYRFGEDFDLGHIVDGTVDREGNILMLSYRWSDSTRRNEFEIVRCNFRGEPLGKVEIKNLPFDFLNFSPNRMIYTNGKFYLASLNQMKFIVIDSDGNFVDGHDLFPILELEEKDRGNIELSGFSVGNDGSILFTIPVLFKAYIFSPDRTYISFGKPGGAPGRFNVVAGIVQDKKGNILVVDKLKCTIMVFDKNYNFLTQFGYRGPKGGNLIAPDDIAIENKKKF